MARATRLKDDLDGQLLPAGTEPLRLSLGDTTYRLHLAAAVHAARRHRREAVLVVAIDVQRKWQARHVDEREPGGLEFTAGNRDRTAADRGIHVVEPDAPGERQSCAAAERGGGSGLEPLENVAPVHRVLR